MTRRSQDPESHRVDGLDHLAKDFGKWPTPVRVLVQLSTAGDGTVQVTAAEPDFDSVDDSSDTSDYGAKRARGKRFPAGPAEIILRPEVLSTLIAERNAAIRMVHALRSQLSDAITPADRTVVYGYGEKRGDGQAPSTGSLWLTPREIVAHLLKDPRLDPLKP